MSKIIIGIHGLGNKPPKAMLEAWWLQSICEGLININRFQFEPKFEMVNWADILNDKPLNDLITDPENPYYIDEPYRPGTNLVELKQNTKRKKFLGFLEDQMDKIFLNEDLSSNFNFVSEMVFKKYFKELDIYYSEQPEVNDSSYKSVKDIIRNRLAETLRRHKGKEIFLISHSMGSIIAYDVCNFLVPNIKIETLVTMGSPLGFPVIVSKIAEELKVSHPKIVKLQTPPNIQKNWVNYTDLEDNVALNYNLSDDYDTNSLGVRATDEIIQNNYSVGDERNPHKSYGYLRTPEFSNLLADFIEKDRSKLKLWWLKKEYELGNLFKNAKDKVIP